METNYLIIGSGAAGLTLAVKLAESFPKKRIAVVTKADQGESNTKYAQGGVAAVSNFNIDSFQKHIEDTVIAGDGLCDRSVVEMVITEGPGRLRELMEWGARFDTNPSGELNLGREGGHSEYRIIHHKDSTGKEIERALLDKVEKLQNITLLSHHFAIDLITHYHLHNRPSNPDGCYGAYVLDQISGKVLAIKADTTTLASGGVGVVYGHTTNPAVATGDGVAMAFRAKAAIKNMEFIQFHPTAFYDGKEGTSFLISEAVRGFGAYLRNGKGERFVFKHDVRGELASRDIVSRAIDSEIKTSGANSVYLDCTHLDPVEFKIHFPEIYKTCLNYGLDIMKERIPVVPAAHYLCGGVVVDLYGRTSISNLFACGECSQTGLHGANRLASNSLLEALVYADRICEFHKSHPIPSSPVSIPQWSECGTVFVKDQQIILDKISELQMLMRNFAGVVRTCEGLGRARLQLEKLYEETEVLYQDCKLNSALLELRNMITVSNLIVAQSLSRQENRGGYFNKNFKTQKIN